MSASWGWGRASLFVLAFGMPCASTKPPPAAKPTSAVAAPKPISAMPVASPAPVPHDSVSEGDLAGEPVGPRLPPTDAELGRRLVSGSAGVPIGKSGPARYTSGAHECPPSPGATCEIGKVLDCEVHDRVSCWPACDGYRTQYYICDNGSWHLRETGEPSCRCAPKKLPAELAACTTRYVDVRPSSLSPTDGCSLGLSCAGRDLWLECDGENDGTETSLCSCWRDRREQNIGGLYPGEGPDACFAAAADCSKLR